MKQANTKDILSIVNGLNIYTQVDRKDRPFVKNIVEACLTFDELMPKLTFAINPHSRYYNLIVRGWVSRFSMAKWYRKMESDDRDPRCEFIRETSCIPSPVTGNGPVILIKIDKSNSSIITKKREY